MLSPYEFAVGWRYVRSGEKRSFISFISLVSMVGIATGVFVLIVVLSVMNGFERTLRERILDVTSHGAILGYNAPLDNWLAVEQQALADQRVATSAPFVDGQGLLVAGDGRRTSGVQVRGIEAQRERKVASLESHLADGVTLQVLKGKRFRILLGASLAEALAVGVGDRVTLMIPQASVTPAGVLPRMRRFEVAGIFEAGMYDYDRRLAFVDLRDAQALYRLGDRVSGLRLRFHDAFDAPRAVRDIALELGEIFYVRDWTREHLNFFRAIAMTKSVMFTILLLVVAVAAFNIVSTLIMVVNEKRGDIAIMRTVGAAPMSILGVFMTQGLVIGAVGTLGGLVAGALVTLNIDALVAFAERLLSSPLVDASVYYIDELPADLLPTDLVLVCGTALVLTLASTLYPAWRASATPPAETLRHDS